MRDSKDDNMKIAVISTIKNEESLLRPMLDSILNQSLKPTELIIVDGGSTDSTIKILEEYKIKFKKHKVKTLIKIEPGKNIAQGRNIAIKLAKSEWIASLDGGCVAKPDWLKEMAKTAKKVDIVSGNFEPIAKGIGEKIQAVFVKRSTKTNPSSRSIMFKKSCWTKVGGYPEHLYTGEDTLFNARMEETGCKFEVADKAIVEWRMRASLKKWLRQFYLYGKGDGQAGLRFKTGYGKKIASLLIISYVFLITALMFPQIIIVPFIASIFYGLYMNHNIYGLLAGLVLPLRLIAYLLGFHVGIINKPREEKL
ncbi:MAG: glycosyltransferase [Candidatus Altiarchaeota archaeon]|nr:glycosyltransferase [Candidatus Altiarchaeota archaeon]